MSDLGEIAERVGARFKEESRKFLRASIFVKLVLVIGGATAAAVADCVEIARRNGELSWWTAVGLAGAAAVAIGGIFVALTEHDPAQTLETARRALEEARLRERRMDRFNSERARLRKEIDRGLQLYNSMDVLRGAIEVSLDIPEITVEKIIRTALKSARNSLEIALAFETGDIWTICVFKATRPRESAKFKLKLIAHERKIDCKIYDAREWDEGVGVAGISFSMKNEIIVPDMFAPELGTVFNLDDDSSRSYDSKRYRSIVAVPIRVLFDAFPWGVVVITTDRPDHFDIESTGGIPTYEAARAIAAMAALAVKALGDHNSESADQGEPAAGDTDTHK